MASIQPLNTTDLRVSRTLHHSPLLNLLLATSILSKITQGKAYLQSPWVPFRPIFGYYPQHPFPSLWYPIDPFVYPPKLHHPLNHPQTPPSNQQQQIVHIHEAPLLTSEAESYETSKNNFAQNSFTAEESPQEIDPSSSNLSQQTSLAEDDMIGNYTADIMDEYESTAPNNASLEDMYYNIKLLYDNNETQPPIINLIMNRIEGANLTTNEIPEPNTPYGKPLNQNHSVFENVDDQIAEENLVVTINPSNEITTTNQLYTTYDNDVAESDDDVQIIDPNDELKITNLQEELGAMDDDLEGAEANNYNRRKQRPQQNYDYDYDYGNKRRPGNNAAQRKPQRPYNTQQPSRINSKKGQYRPNYQDYYDITTPRYNRRKTTPKRNQYRRRTTASYYDDYYDRPNNRMKPVKNRRPTTPSYYDYDADYERDYHNEDLDEDYNNNRQSIRPRQEVTTETSTETSSESTTTETTSTTQTTTTTSTPTPPPPSSTTVGYPYYGPAGSGNVSITYGPPPPNSGYGPSNGNEHVSITYGPPTGSNGHIAPLLDSWYNQYAKSTVIRRIQDLLTPQNYYSPQYDIDKFNYNDMTIF